MIDSVYIKHVKKLDGNVLDGWTQSHTENGVPYYVNHHHTLTQWDHPDFIRLRDDLLQFNNIKYAAYRTACKFRMLQKILRFDRASLQSVSSAFDAAGLRSSDHKAIISIEKIEIILHFILRAAYKSTAANFSVIIEIIINLILNSFNENRNGKLEVLQCKIFLVALSGGRLQEKYRYIFSQIADKNNCCTKKKLAQILYIISSIPELLSEQLSFGVSYVPAAVASCFKELNQSDEGVPEDHFLNWLLQEPQLLVWWTTAYRLSVSEIVCHDVKCSVCKQYPCIGLRYQCLHCLSYNLCQDCFLLGYTSKSHKTTHPIQEYCHESSAKEWRKSVLKIFRHRLKISRHFKPRYLSLTHPQPLELHLSALLQDTLDNLQVDNEIDGARTLTDGNVLKVTSTAVCDSVNTVELLGICHTENDFKDIVSDGNVTPLSSTQLINSVIMHLEEGNKQLCERLENYSSEDSLPIVIKQHISELQMQIQKLQRVLKVDNSNSFLLSKRKVKRSKNDLQRMESTPIVGERGLHLSLSPIGTEPHNDSAVLDNKENHNVEKNCFHDVISSTKHDITECDTITDGRGLLTISGSQINSSQGNSVRPKVLKRYPSFSEMSLADLTSTSSIASSGTPISNNNIYKEFQDELRRMKIVNLDDSKSESLKQELDSHLKIFEDMFPVILKEKSSGNCPDEILTSANELCDIIVTYIETLPLQSVQVF